MGFWGDFGGFFVIFRYFFGFIVNFVRFFGKYFLNLSSKLKCWRGFSRDQNLRTDFPKCDIFDLVYIFTVWIGSKKYTHIRVFYEDLVHTNRFLSLMFSNYNCVVTSEVTNLKSNAGISNKN